ncbi:HAD family hydrolase [Desulfomicrobium sp. ZS1]|uniref:HAD family hydrolase n=1 Tax=Desulfomicrobium sp. ZS1 TaxID=2952228 RepID=UPI0020B34804|nr:HAD family hydrolase [Desulfomicrobium sp. ZS1]UTF51729.1 HAD family hydrolase [Desulfomicrobium sp. ZS1]
MKYKTVVFDMDGTLLDTLADLGDAMNRVLEQHGFASHPINAYRQFVGSGAGQLVARALPAHEQDEDLKNRCLRAFLREYEAGWRIKTCLYEGVPELLDALAARNIPMAVLTNKPQDFAELCVREFLSRWDFALTVGQMPGVPVKPDPAGPRQVIRHLGVQPDEILYLGDTDVDMFTAVNAGMYPVGVLWGFRPEQELLESGAAATLTHPMELLRFLD